MESDTFYEDVCHARGGGGGDGEMGGFREEEEEEGGNSARTDMTWFFSRSGWINRQGNRATMYRIGDGLDDLGQSREDVIKIRWASLKTEIVKSS